MGRDGPEHAGRLCEDEHSRTVAKGSLLQSPKDQEKLEIFAPLPYRRGHGHDSFLPSFPSRLPASSPRRECYCPAWSNCLRRQGCGPLRGGGASGAQCSERCRRLLGDHAHDFVDLVAIWLGAARLELEGECRERLRAILPAPPARVCASRSSVSKPPEANARSSRSRRSCNRPGVRAINSSKSLASMAAQSWAR
jgi:hypothetical protein